MACNVSDATKSKANWAAAPWEQSTGPRIRRSGRTVAIKMILMSNQSDEEVEQFKQRFYREAQTAGQMSHPGIVTIYDVNEDEYGQPYLVMEFIEGTTLDKVLAPAAAGKRLSAVRFVRLSILPSRCRCARLRPSPQRHPSRHQTCQYSGYHRGQGQDRRFRYRQDGGTQMTHTGLLVGTPAFMSPEQITGGRVDNRSDIFAFASCLLDV